MTPAEDLLAERIRDVERWAADHPGDGLALAVVSMPPVSPSEVAACEATIRKKNPRGLPARCVSCHRRLAMCQLDLERHPKCPEPSP